MTAYDLTGTFNGSEYEIKVPFEKILFERRTDLSTSTLSNNLWAWCVDKSENATSTKPIVFYCDRETKNNKCRYCMGWIVVIHLLFVVFKYD